MPSVGFDRLAEKFDAAECSNVAQSLDKVKRGSHEAGLVHASNQGSGG